MIENRFNLVDEPWIPVAEAGRVSLRQIFTHPEYRSLGGNAVQKISLMKLLLAIAQAAATPADGNGWRTLGTAGLCQRCLAYLERWHDMVDPATVLDEHAKWQKIWDDLFLKK
jgi:CRISPR system Cascade subunit CasA